TTRTFTGLTINGPSNVGGNTSQQYTATAYFSDNSGQAVSPSWSINSSAAAISSGGLLVAGEVAGDTMTTLSASFSIGGVTRNAYLDVLIVNSATPPGLYSLSINGPSLMNQNSTALFT